MPNIVDFSTSIIASSCRGWRGTMAAHPAQNKPEKMLELYEFEASPYCRLVREALTELDLDALIYPCPKGGKRFRPTAESLCGKQQFPLLVDPNTDDKLLESADIITHLKLTYGSGGRASDGMRRNLALAGAMGATLSRSVTGFRGLKVRPSSAPEIPLELFSFESSPYSRPVRELLCELEIPYILRNFAKSRWEEMGPPSVRKTFFPDAPITSPNRSRMMEMTGRMQVPYLIDPNTGTSMYESDAIRKYLLDTYSK